MKLLDTPCSPELRLELLKEFGKHPKQKFHNGTIVYITKNMPDSMKHFNSNFIGFVCGTYASLYGGDDFASYSITPLDDANTTSWYKESQLTLIDSETLGIIRKLGYPV